MVSATFICTHISNVMDFIGRETFYVQIKVLILSESHIKWFLFIGYIIQLRAHQMWQCPQNQKIQTMPVSFSYHPWKLFKNIMKSFDMLISPTILIEISRGIDLKNYYFSIHSLNHFMYWFLILWNTWRWFIELKVINFFIKNDKQLNFLTSKKY